MYEHMTMANDMKTKTAPAPATLPPNLREKVIPLWKPNQIQQEKSLLRLHELGPVLGPRDLHSADVLVHVQDELQRVPGAEVWQGSLGALETDTRLDLAGGRDFRFRPGQGKHLLEDFVGSQGETELR